MRIYDIIRKKRDKEELSKEEIEFFVDRYSKGEIPDYQASALLMAIYLNKMNKKETAYLTEAMMNSGEVMDLSAINGVKVDKHSTGGVGDKTTIALAPLMAACGVPVAKMSGRGLGHTGGTLDKLESIPGFSIEMTPDKFIKSVNDLKIAVCGQTASIAVADKKMYALRDVTATVDSMPLIASSVVSKKIASGAKNIILDVKYGSGAFMKSPQDAIALSRLIVNIGKILNKSITAVITSMEEPLGRAIGNSLEIIESIEFLKGKIEKSDIAELTYDIAALALMQVGMYDNKNEAKEFLNGLVQSGQALEKFKELIQAQGGDSDIIDNYDKFDLPEFKVEYESKKDGLVQKIDAYKIAYACKILGAGREKKTDNIDYSVGIYLNKKSGEAVKKGEILYTIYSNDETKTRLAQKYCDEAFEINGNKIPHKNLIYKVIKAEEVEDV